MTMQGLTREDGENGIIRRSGRASIPNSLSDFESRGEKEDVAKWERKKRRVPWMVGLCDE